MPQRDSRPRVCNQVQIETSCCVKDVLHGRFPRWIGGDARHAETQRSPLSVNTRLMQVTQVLEDGRIATWTIKMPADDGAPLFAWTRSIAIPADAMHEDYRCVYLLLRNYMVSFLAVSGQI